MQRFFLKYQIIFSLLSVILFSHAVNAQDTGDLFIIDPSIAPHGILPEDPLDDLPPLNELLDQGARPGTGGNNPDSILPQDLAEEYAYRYLEKNPSEDDLRLFDPLTGDSFLYNEEMFLNGEEPQLIPPGENIDRFTIDFIPNTSSLCCFYSRLPRIVLGSTTKYGPIKALGFDTITKLAASKSALNTALEGFKKSPLSKNAFVKSGLLHTRNVLLIENDDGDTVYQGSPSQYKSTNKTIYINVNDLKEYGYVVILHELIQAGLDHGVSRDYINNSDFSTIRNVGKNYFPNLQLGYVNSRNFFGVENFTTIKAFAFGQTYKLLKQHYGSLSTEERTKARRFFRDIENNKFLFPLTIRLGTGGTASLDFHLMGHPSRVSQRDIDDYTDSFTDGNSAVNKAIQPVEDKISRGANKYIFSRILPAITR